jgi:hypothetical protein
MSWDTGIGAGEDARRVAFLNADPCALDELLADDPIVHSPLDQVLSKPLLPQLLAPARRAG